jgi:hypothetical protein
MRFVFIIYAIILLQNLSFAQTDSITAKIYILATIHNGNNKFGFKDLAKELEKLNPDIILWEQSVPFKRVFGLRTANFLKIWRPGIEQLALQKYTGKKATCEVMPYDTTILNRRAYLKTLQQNGRKVFDLLSSMEKSKSDSISLAAFFHTYNTYYNGLENQSLLEINQSATVDKMRELYKLKDSIIARQLIQYSVDSVLNRWYLNEQYFWEARNSYMAAQIERIASASPSKKIVVLTGLAHKYILEDKLNNKIRIRLMKLTE